MLNSSQRSGALTPSCRLIFSSIVFGAILGSPPAESTGAVRHAPDASPHLPRLVLARLGLEERDVHRRVADLRPAGSPGGQSRLQPLAVVSIREVRLVVG